MNTLCIVNSTIHEHNTRQRHMIHTNSGHPEISFKNVGPCVWYALLNIISIYIALYNALL